MQQPLLAYFITWTCYGTFLPGDQRGWTKWHGGDQLPQPLLEDWCRDRLSNAVVLLNEAQREEVNDTVRRHCELRGWTLHAVNCRSNHCHVVVTASDVVGGQVRDQLKAWATRNLRDQERIGRPTGQKSQAKLWSRRGSVRHIFDEESLAAAIMYTRDAQDMGGSKANP